MWRIDNWIPEKWSRCVLAYLRIQSKVSKPGLWGPDSLTLTLNKTDALDALSNLLEELSMVY